MVVRNGWVSFATSQILKFWVFALDVNSLIHQVNIWSKGQSTISPEVATDCGRIAKQVVQRDPIWEFDNVSNGGDSTFQAMQMVEGSLPPIDIEFPFLVEVTQDLLVADALQTLSVFQ